MGSLSLIKTSLCSVYCISCIKLPPSKMLLQIPGRLHDILRDNAQSYILTFELCIWHKCKKCSVDVNLLLLACKYLLYFIEKHLDWVLSLTRIFFSAQISLIYAICRMPKAFISKLQQNTLQLLHFKLSFQILMGISCYLCF